MRKEKAAQWIRFVQLMLIVPVTLPHVLLCVLLKEITGNKETGLLEAVKEVRS